MENKQLKWNTYMHICNIQQFILFTAHDFSFRYNMFNQWEII